MPQVIDLAEVQSAMEMFKEKGRDRLEAPGYQGVLSRLQHEAAPELTYWRCREINRDTPPDQMAEALVMFFAATMAGEIRQATENQDAQFTLANEIINGFANMLGRILTSQEAWNECAVQIMPKEAGNA